MSGHIDTYSLERPLVIPTLQHTISPNELTRNVNILTATGRPVMPLYQSTGQGATSSAAPLFKLVPYSPSLPVFQHKQDVSVAASTGFKHS